MTRHTLFVSKRNVSYITVPVRVPFGTFIITAHYRDESHPTVSIEEKHGDKHTSEKQD